METMVDIYEVACDMIRSKGPAAISEVQETVTRCLRDGEDEEAALWAAVSVAIRHILGSEIPTPLTAVAA